MRFFRDGDALSRLIAYLLGSFILILVLRILSQFSMMPVYGTLMPYFTLPADLSGLLFKPWTLFSYMFVHEDFTHILFNLLYLYFAGRITILSGCRQVVVHLYSRWVVGRPAVRAGAQSIPLLFRSAGTGDQSGGFCRCHGHFGFGGGCCAHFPVRLFFVLRCAMCDGCFVDPAGLGLYADQ